MWRLASMSELLTMPLPVAVSTASGWVVGFVRALLGSMLVRRS